MSRAETVLPTPRDAVLRALPEAKGDVEEEEEGIAPVVKVDVNKGVVVGVAMAVRDGRMEDVVDPDRVV